MKSPHLLSTTLLQLFLLAAIGAAQTSFAETSRLDSATFAEGASALAADKTAEWAGLAKKAAEDYRKQGNEEEAKKWEERAKAWEKQAQEFRDAQSAAKFAGDAVRSGNKLAERSAKYQINKGLKQAIGGDVPKAVQNFIDNNLVESAAAGSAYKSLQY